MNKAMKARLIILTLCVFAVTGCFWKWNDLDPSKPLLSLASGDSFCTYVDMCPYVSYDRQSTKLVFDMCIFPEKYAEYHGQPDNDRDFYYIWPSDDIWDKFQDDACVVKAVYKDCVYHLENAADKQKGTETLFSTIFPVGELKIVADKDFKGILAGEDLSSIFEPAIVFPDAREFVEDMRLDTIDDLVEAIPEHCVSKWRFETHGPLLLKDPVTFTFALPVSKVMLLGWIKDLIDDPYAKPECIDGINLDVQGGRA